MTRSSINIFSVIISQKYLNKTSTLKALTDIHSIHYESDNGFYTLVIHIKILY